MAKAAKTKAVKAKVNEAPAAIEPGAVALLGEQIAALQGQIDELQLAEGDSGKLVAAFGVTVEALGRIRDGLVSVKVRLSPAWAGE